MNISVEYKVGDKVCFEKGSKEYRIIGYQYVEPTLTYIAIDNEGNQKYCLPIEIEAVKENKIISFIKGGN